MTSYAFYADSIDSEAEATGTTVFVSGEFDRDTVVRAVRIGLVIYNNPTFTSATMKIYTDKSLPGNAKSPKKLVATSDSRSKSEITTMAYGYREVYFTFNDVVLHAGETYNFVLNLAGYSSPSASSHVAWVRDFAIPIYGEETAATGLFRSPRMIQVVGAPYVIL